MRVEFLRRALIAPIVLLASCGAASSNDPVEGEAWLSLQYFGDREVAMLPNLGNRTVFGMETWHKAGPSEEVAGDGGETYAYRVMLSHYFPGTTFGTDLDKTPRRSFTTASEVLDRLAAERREAEAVVGMGRVNLATIRLISGVDVNELTRQAKGKDFDVKYSSNRCVIMDIYGPAKQNRETSIFVAGINGVWDLNDRAVERCIVGGIVTIMGMNTRYVMSNVDRLYPHMSARWPCAFAASGPRAREFLEQLSFAPCRSGVRYKWPQAVLRAAVRSGGLPPGPIRREAFDAALASAARTLGDEARVRVMREDAASIAAARTAPKTLPPIVPSETIAPGRM